MRRTILVTSLAVALAACSKRETSGPVVADGGGIQITSKEFLAKLDEQSPLVKARYASLERKKEFLENLIRFELLAKEAERRGLAKDPEVQQTLKRIMVQKLVRAELDEGDKAQATDPEIREYYEKNRDEFVRPERVRVALVVVDAPAGAPDRAAKAALARKAYARLKSEGQRNPLTFGNVARDVSTDDASRAAGGDVGGFRTQDELTKQYGKEIASAAFALSTPGQESPLIESPRGFAIVKLSGRQPGVNRSLEEVKPQLQGRASRDKRAKEYDEYVTKLRGKASITIHDAELEKIQVAAPGAGTLVGGK